MAKPGETQKNRFAILNCLARLNSTRFAGMAKNRLAMQSYIHVALHSFA